MPGRFGVAFILLFACAPLAAQSAVQPFAAVGFGAPVGSLGDLAEPGLFANAGVSVSRPDSPLGWRAEVVFAPFGTKSANFSFGGEGISVESDARVIGALASATYALGSQQGAARPYVVGGLGFFSTRIEGTVSGFGDEFDNLTASESKSSPGFQLGGGVRFAVGSLSAFAEARYQHVMRAAFDVEDESDSGRWKSAGFVPITIGITLGR